MLIHFTKMHGLGNDFVVIDRIMQSFTLRSTHIKHLSDRHLGIGCDQLLLIEPPIRPDADFFYRIFNANGKEVEQCGNGLRCAARFFYDRGFSNGTQLEADCIAGPTRCTIETDGTVRAEMGVPNFDPPAIPFLSDQEMLTYAIQLDRVLFEASVLSLGNPHAIIQVPDVDTVDLKKIGQALSTHSAFPKAVNVGFMQVINRTQIKLRVYERDVGETLACGSNACAAVVSGIRLGLLNNEVQVLFQKGALTIQWQGPQCPVILQGPVHTSFVGQFRV